MVKKKIAQKTFSGLLTVSFILAIGTLSLVGALEFTTLIYICGLAFLMAGFVDGQVSWENIYGAIKSLFDENFLERLIMRQRLQAILMQHPDNIFIQAYLEAHKRLAYLRRWHDALPHEEHGKIKEMEERLVVMEDFLCKRIRNRGVLHHLRTPMEQAADALIQEGHFDGLEQEVSRKKWWGRLGLCLAIGAGGFNFFATLGAFQAAFNFVNALNVIAVSSILSMIPGGVVVTVMAFAAFGYIFMLYKSWCDLLFRNVLQNWYQMIRDATQNQTAFKVAVIYFATLLTITLAFFAMVATGGTWFQLVPDGAALFTITDSLTQVIQFIGIGFMAIPALFFNIANVGKASIRFFENTAQGFFVVLSNYCEQCIHDLQQAWAEENAAQFFNPFRLIVKILAFVTFVFHLISDGFASDGFPEPTSSTVAGVVTNGLIETTYVFHELNFTGENNEQNNNHEQKGLFSAHHITTYDDDHHSHVFTDLLLFLPRYIGIFWDLFLGTLWYPVSLGYCYFQGIAALDPPSYAKAKARFYPSQSIPATEGQPDNVSSAWAEWLRQEAIERCYQQQATQVQSYAWIPQLINQEVSTLVPLVDELKKLELKTDGAIDTKGNNGTIPESEAEFDKEEKSITLSEVIYRYSHTQQDQLQQERFLLCLPTPTESLLVSMASEPNYQKVRCTLVPTWG